MENKTLRIIFSGISTLCPGAPRDGEAPPKEAFVMMAANSAEGLAVPPHFPFVHARSWTLDNPPPPDEKTSHNHIYFFRDARVVIDPGPAEGTPIEYFVDSTKPMADRPGSDDVAPASDIRWLADLRDIVPGKVAIKPTADPAEKSVGEEVAGIVNLPGGLLSANFPCDTVQPRAFVDENGKPVNSFRRVLASEFIIDIPYAADIEKVTLRFRPLRKGTDVQSPNSPLVFKWQPGKPLLVVRMGNDTKEEVLRLDREERCDPLRDIGPVLKPRDEEFDLHYNLLQIPPTGRPLPQTNVRHCVIENCKPLAIPAGGSQ